MIKFGFINSFNKDSGVLVLKSNVCEADTLTFINNFNDI